MTDTDHKPKVSLVIGAAGGIGSAVVRRLLAEAVTAGRAEHSVITVSRSPTAPCHGVSLHLCCDYSEQAITGVCDQLRSSNMDLSRVIIANGILHGDGIRPERSLRQIDGAAMASVLQANAIVPLLWLSGLFDLIKQASAPRIGVLSARVGSIGDNSLGGWHSYRGSKAALNMMLQCAAIELHRVNPRTRVMAFHPGTTDTALSKPFQKGVAADKLFTPEFVAQCMLRELDKTAATGQLNYVDWAGKPIPW